MHANVKLIYKPLSVINSPFHQRLEFSSVPLKLAEATYASLEETNILVQSIDHHLVHIHLYDYKVKSFFIIDFEVTENSFFMIVLQDDNSILYNEQGEVLSEIFGNSCRLAYLKAGKYKRSLMGGSYQILLLTISPEWLISKYGKLDQFQELIDSFNKGTASFFSLPSANITKQIFNNLLKLNILSKRRDVEIDLLIFLNNCINKYLHKLGQGQSTVKSHVQKAGEIAEFVKTYYASKIVGDEVALADHFMISTTMLIRLAKLAFDKPLHKQVIELRMHHGLKMLLSTESTIQEISVSVGYDDPKYFSRAFKKTFGMPPNDVRTYVV
ncbi:helix-turn-helix transcriptional regulator [Pedobacter gandavensis]|uniref:Helix-turn-helix domain-containing protein n=1 Tax=Pedobacter gandavensis TaxID=2679963 RepID=A0ABR6ET83_9SPHI|nr:helix-turn-helix transcriptional regulator [Pedobacter gandavensis]MBB2148479.1 helix-turn-helix domain-containing protein [Pedobacter gandavensis]